MSLLHFLESKDHLIDKLALSDEQKDRLKAFFKKHPNYESKIDWNNRALSWEDFRSILTLEGKSKTQAEKVGLSGLTEGTDYTILAEDPDSGYTLFEVKTHLASRVLASKKVGVGNVTGKWCISMNSGKYWDQYIFNGWTFYFLILMTPNKALDKYSYLKKVAFAYNPRCNFQTFDATDELFMAWQTLQFLHIFTDKKCLQFERKMVSAYTSSNHSILRQTQEQHAAREAVPALAAITTGPSRVFARSSGGDYSFQKPSADRVYVKVLMMLRRHPLTKRQILINLALNKDFPSGNLSSDWAENMKHVGGQHSAMFLAMREAGLIQYSPSTRQWSLGENGEQYIQYWDLLNEWKRYIQIHPRKDRF